MQAVRGVVAHESEVVQVEDAGVAEVSIRIAGNDSLVFPCFPFIMADGGCERRADIVLLPSAPIEDAL